MKKPPTEFALVDIHDADALARHGQKLVIVDGEETIVEMTDADIEAHTGEVLPDELRDAPTGDV